MARGHGTAGNRRPSTPWSRAARAALTPWLLCLLALAIAPVGLPARGAVIPDDGLFAGALAIRTGPLGGTVAGATSAAPTIPDPAAHGSAVQPTTTLAPAPSPTVPAGSGTLPSSATPATTGGATVTATTEATPPGSATSGPIATTIAAPGAGSSTLGPLAAAASPSPQLSVRPDAGPPQTVATLAGSGFVAEERVVVIYTDARNTLSGVRPIGSATADGNGTIAPFEVTIPPSASPGSLGMLSLIGNRCASGQGCVLGDNRAQAEASLPFAVTPLASAVAVDRAIVPAGGTIGVSGSGYEPGTAITLALIVRGGALMPLATLPITTTVTGMIEPITVPVPASVAPGLAALNVVDGAGNVAGIPLTILDPSSATPDAVTIDPARAALGTFIRFTAAGLPPNEPVSVTLTGAAGTSVPIEIYPLTDAATPFNQPLGNPVATLTADASGSVHGGFVLPRIGGVTLGGAPGLGGDGNGGTMVTLGLHGAGDAGDSGRDALLLVAGAKIQTFPPIAIPGHPYTTVGSGFVAGESVQVSALDERGTLSQVGQAVAADCQSVTTPFGQSTTQVSPPTPCVSGTFVLNAIAPTPPAAAGGSAGVPAAGFRLSAIGQTSGLYAGARLVTTTAPTLTLRPYVVAPGGIVEVQGHAFSPNVALIIRAGGSLAATLVSGAIQPPAPGPSVAAADGCTDSSGARCATRIPASVPVQTDTSGFFSIRFTVPPGTGNGPIPIAAVGDPSRSGSGVDAASVVLTVSTQHALLSVTPHSAMPQQVITIRGSGFASGETVDLFLTQPGAPGLSVPDQTGGSGEPVPLPDTTLSVAADSLGAIAASYPLPNAIAPGSYIVAARGETSDVRAINALVIGGGPTPTPIATCAPHTCVPPTRPSPTPPPTPTPCAANPRATARQGASCGPTSGGSTESVAYFAGGSTAQSTVTVPGYAGYATVRYSANTRQDLHLTNGGDQPASVVIAYLLYAVVPSVLPPVSHPASGSEFASLTKLWPALWLPRGGGSFQLSRRRVLTLAPHSTQIRSVNGDIGNGHLVSIIVRFSTGSAPPDFSLASARPTQASAVGASHDGSGAGGIARAIVTLVTHRILQVAGLQAGHLPRLGGRSCSNARPCALTLDGGSTAGTILPEGPAASASSETAYSTAFAEGLIRGAGGTQPRPSGPATTMPAEGTTLLTFFNPQSNPVTAQVRFLSASGPLRIRARVNLVPFGRQTIGVDDLLGDLCPKTHGIATLACLPGTPAGARARPLAAMGLSVVVTASEPLVVERSLFWGEAASAGSPIPSSGGFDQAAAVAANPAHSGTPDIQYIPYASTLNGERATLTLANAGTGTATMRIDAYTSAGVRVAAVGGGAIGLQAQSRIAIPLGCATSPARCPLPPGSYTIAIASSTPINAELTQYADGPSGSGAVIAASDGRAGPADGGWRAGNGFVLAACTSVPCQDGARIMLRVFNPAGVRLVARIATIQSNGTDGVVAYQIGPRATSQLLLPIAGIGSVGRASPNGGSGQEDAVATVVECGGPCAAVAIQGMPAETRPHAGSGAAQGGGKASPEVLAAVLR